MYTQCPKCQTVFRITMEQLQVHNGLVRCGHCQHVFSADQQLFDEIPSSEVEPAVEKKSEAPVAKKRGAGKSKTGDTRTSRTKTRAPKTRVEQQAAQDVVEIAAAPAPWIPTLPEQDPKPVTARAAHRAEPVAETKPRAALQSKARPRATSAWWMGGSVVLLLMLTTQAGYFYRHELAAHKKLRPTLIEMCDQIGCELPALTDIARIELIQPTNIAPHPKFTNLLRLRATMVNRAANPQPYPLMELTLTDSQGRILARRTFTPNEYLERPGVTESQMSPHVAVAALLDITNPDGKATGYEISFASKTTR